MWTKDQRWWGIHIPRMFDHTTIQPTPFIPPPLYPPSIHQVYSLSPGLPVSFRYYVYTKSEDMYMKFHDILNVFFMFFDTIFLFHDFCVKCRFFQQLVFCPNTSKSRYRNGVSSVKLQIVPHIIFNPFFILKINWRVFSSSSALWSLTDNLKQHFPVIFVCLLGSGLPFPTPLLVAGPLKKGFFRGFP